MEKNYSNLEENIKIIVRIYIYIIIQLYFMIRK